MMKNLLIILLFFTGNLMIFSQACSVNAGADVIICGTTTTLQGAPSGTVSGTPTWSIVSKPSGAPDPVFSNPNAYTPNVTGITSPGNYVFMITQPCPSGPAVTSQVTVTAPGANTGFTAGPDITNVNATVGTVTLNGVVPAGYTAQWSAYNLWRYERSSGTITSQNSTFGSPTSATTTFSLINKANHEIDPSYVVTLRITSINNPNCWYEDTAIVRFIPNPNIILPTSKTECIPTNGRTYLDMSSGSPIFGTTTPGAAGNPSYGTIITLNVISQPAGANMAFSQILDTSFTFTGATTPGVYKFTATVSNSAGTYTSPEITYTNLGRSARPVSFLVASEPEQMMIYDTGNSGGRVYCGMAGSTAPLTFSYTIDATDPITVTSSVVSSGVVPPGGNPSNITTTGSGTLATRTTTVTPPSGGWRVGTYRFTVSTNNGVCAATTQQYYIHISDGARPNVSVNNITVCYPGSGTVTATVPLPAVYKGIVNSSYLQDFDGAYDFTLVSSPAGAGTPTYQARNQRLFTLASTTISNLTTPGEYVFKIKPGTYISSVGAFLDKEYACSGTSMEGTFSIFVSAQVGSNAGSNQNITTTQTTLNANNPGVASGMWTLVSKPSGAIDPVIATPSSYSSNVTGMYSSGTYTFRWTVTTGTCVSTSDVNINVLINNCVTGCNPNTFVNTTSDFATIEYDNMVSSYHATIVRESNGTFKVWGQDSQATGAGDLLSPTVVGPTSTATPATNFVYAGTPLRATAGSGNGPTTYSQQFALLTTDGLYVWGVPNMLISSSIKNTNAFGKITVNGKTDGLPTGVLPGQVKMMFGSFGTLAIVTCSGEAWVLSTNGSKNGDGSTQNSGTPNSNTVWHRVKTSATADLNGVVAMRGTGNALFALTSDSKLYTWGTGTYINNTSTGATARTYATEVTVPAGVTPKMIGMTEAIAAQSYYLLATDGKLYTMGDNSTRQLGDLSTTTRNTWVQPQKPAAQGQGTGVLDNIVWISPNEHSNSPFWTTSCINVLTNTNKQWAWGKNDEYMIGAPPPSTALHDPIYMPGNSTNANGMKVTDEIIAVETGGHTSVNVKKGENRFGYVGHRTNGSMGDGSNANDTAYTYTYNTATLAICAAATSALCYKPGAVASAGNPALISKAGITSLTRASASGDNWPAVRNGGWLVLEAKTKGFVPNRLAFSAGNPVGIAPANFVEGMMVYDTTNKCMKMYTSQDGGTTFGWYCITTQACPD